MAARWLTSDSRPPGSFLWRVVPILASAFLSATAFAQRQQSYAGQDAREIKALSADVVKLYLSGAGAGFARAAELNHFLGPMHVLELADPLNLTAGQRAQTERLMSAHKAQARTLGEKVVATERALDELFGSGRRRSAAVGRGACCRAGARRVPPFASGNASAHARPAHGRAGRRLRAAARLRGRTVDPSAQSLTRSLSALPLIRTRRSAPYAST
jgi:hypothetical protein